MESEKPGLARGQYNELETLETWSSWSEKVSNGEGFAAGEEHSTAFWLR
jgi:hypothetical protein